MIPLNIKATRLYNVIAAFALIHFSLCSDLDDPEGIAYDWVHKRIYFSDYIGRSIESVGVDGLNRSFIAQANHPRAIVVDPCYG